MDVASSVVILGILVLFGDNLAPISKKSAGSTGKGGASLLGKGSGGKSAGFGPSGNKTTFGSSNKSSNLGSSASKSSNFGSSASKSSNFGSSASKTSTFGASPSQGSSFSSTPSKTFGSTASKPSSFGASAPKDTTSRGPSFLTGGGKISSGLAPSTSKKTYETASYNPKTGKSSTSFGIIWLPGRKRNKKKDVAYSAINYERGKRNERTPAMYNIMSGDSPDYQLQKKKDEEANLLVPEKIKGPIATAASAGAAAIISEAPSNLPTDPEEKLLSHDKEETKEAAGDGINKEKPDTDYLENSDVVNKSPEMKPKSVDKVDSVFISPMSGIKSPPQSATSNPEEDECIVKCLYYTLQCCDCVIM